MKIIKLIIYIIFIMGKIFVEALLIFLIFIWVSLIYNELVSNKLKELSK